MNYDLDEKIPDDLPTTDRLDEDSGIMIRGHIKIFDPESGEILVDSNK